MSRHQQPKFDTPMWSLNSLFFFLQFDTGKKIQTLWEKITYNQEESRIKKISKNHCKNAINIKVFKKNAVKKKIYKNSNNSKENTSCKGVR